MQSDEQVLARFLEGDEAAFEELVKRYEAGLRNVAFGFVRERALAEDIVQMLAEEGAEELPLRQLQLRALDQCIAKLPRERSELALAAYAKDTTIRELASQLERTEGSLYQLLARVRNELRRCMVRELEEEAFEGAES